MNLPIWGAAQRPQHQFATVKIIIMGKFTHIYQEYFHYAHNWKMCSAAVGITLLLAFTVNLP